jgi:RHS repeat-associated protein
LGSIAALTNSSATVVQSYAYDAFGNITSGTPTIAQSYTYRTMDYDPETGLYFYRARYYDSKAGRFLQRDPIGFAGQDINLFVYAGNNPVNRKDPNGLNWHGNWCGPGGSGSTTDCYDAACKIHDECYDKCGIDEKNKMVSAEYFDWLCSEV